MRKPCKISSCIDMSRTYSSLSIQETVIQAFVFLTIISFQCAAQTENSTLLNQPGVVGVWTWNATNQYSPLSDFRNDADRNFYTVWPEDITDPSFKFPCEDRNSKLMLENFTYSINGGLIQTVQYFDLGIVEHYRPYWIRPKSCPECWSWNKPPGWTPIYCERDDIANLYHARAMSAVLQGVRFGVVMVLIQQIAFAIIAILIPVYYQNQTQDFSKVAPIAKKHLKRLSWEATFVEGLHLLALAAAGFLLVEGYGHTGDWRTSAMNTLAYYYRVQTACALVSSFLRQCANSMRIIMEDQPAGKVGNDKLIGMLIGQVVVCVVMVEYLYLTDDEYLNFMIQVVFGVVTVAITFSMSIVIAVGGTSLLYIVKPLLTYVKNVHIRKLMAKNSGAERCPQPQPGTPPGGSL